MAIATINPSTGELVKSFEPLTQAQIEEKLQLAASAFQKHRKTSFADRAKKMMRVAEILESEKDECARHSRRGPDREMQTLPEVDIYHPARTLRANALRYG